MPDVYNWQLGRNMSYRFQTGAQKRQFAAVFNINRCIACQTCTMACKSTWTFSPGQELMWWNNVETKPYGGYPQHWDAKILDLQEQANPGKQVWDPNKKDAKKAPYGTFEGKTIFETADGVNQQATGYIPSEDEWKAPNIFEDTATKYSKEGVTLPEHSGWFFYLQRICNHCTYPACVAACPRNAAYKREEDGIVLIDQQRCRGYRKCVEACPYKKSMYRPSTRTSEKCIGCYPRVEGTDPLTDGLPMETRCMTACIGKIRLQGVVNVGADGQWVEDRQNPLYYLVHVAKIALPLYPQFGTQPNVYYIPPRWVPRAHLEQMFGPGVQAAIDAYTNPSRETLAVLQLFRATQEIIFSYKIEQGPKTAELTIAGQKREIYNDTIIGYSSNGKEVVRVTVDEPLIERPDRFAMNTI
ncbi:4Fe-4S dicluster domain-containing protein [Candidatus Amarobacter glycogenicus]|jgi:nitrate reductase beta subunit|uniref:4Fe-4S dicluster domain-containing protein n=1 Tax=Candidatus Amarobacter glycogenicus TaxID=3140699 RepID=UPI0031362D34|nr:nitrate oxidoreductase subunit beta [Dehalococcoidia bacterium]MCC6269477.1 nitrate oxidoreductase subunit beta [Dehalococcoidia bacterium]